MLRLSKVCAKQLTCIILYSLREIYYYHYFTDCEWGDRENKDLLINSSVTGIDKSVDVIIAYLKIRGLLDE